MLNRSDSALQSIVRDLRPDVPLKPTQLLVGVVEGESHHEPGEITWYKCNRDDPVKKVLDRYTVSSPQAAGKFLRYFDYLLGSSSAGAVTFRHITSGASDCVAMQASDPPTARFTPPQREPLQDVGNTRPPPQQLNTPSLVKGQPLESKNIVVRL